LLKDKSIYFKFEHFNASLNSLIYEILLLLIHKQLITLFIFMY